MYRYHRADLLRILRLTARQLTAWEKAGLVAAGESYSFFDLLQIKKVRDLCARKVRPAVIRQSLEAMQKQVAGMENPLLEAGAFSAGHRIAFRHQGKVVEPIAGQFMFDFSTGPRVVSSAPVSISAEPAAADVAELFARGIAFEEDPNCQTQAVEMYEQVLELDPDHAAAHIKTGRVAEAIQTYGTALQLAPTYADAHYNLALAYEKIKEPRKALKHWRAYVKLDATGPWSVHARNQIQRILQADGLKLVYGGKQV